MFRWLLILSTVLSLELYAEKKVLAFSGSTREDSMHKKLVNEAAQMAKQMGASVTVIDLRDYPMPFYDGDLEDKSGMPDKAKEFRALMEQNDVIVIASPEYNGSISAVLKNAIDWASRGERGGSSRSAFKGKKFVLVSTSPGKGGGARGIAHLKTVIENIGGEIAGQPVTVPEGGMAFDAQGSLTNATSAMNLKQSLKQALKG